MSGIKWGLDSVLVLNGVFLNIKFADNSILARLKLNIT